VGGLGVESHGCRAPHMGREVWVVIVVGYKGGAGGGSWPSLWVWGSGAAVAVGSGE
jgi:hypothetical protein